jgi:phosphate starvation-inducible PhoH-like protein
LGRKVKDKFEEERQREPLVPLTKRQGFLFKQIEKKQCVVTTGFAGTGKTYIACVMAADALLQGAAKGGCDKIILCRPNVATGRPLGFRPGTLEEKLAEWMAEPLAILHERLGATKYQYFMSKGRIEMVPFESIRGRSFNNAWVLLDEAQNTTPDEMKCFITRIGENTKVLINGDVRQSDLYGSSGLMTLIEVVDRYNMDVPVIDFQSDDIVRSDLCKQFIINWTEYEHTT